MRFLGYTVRDILLSLTVIVGVVLIWQLILINQIALALLLLAGLVIPFSFVIMEYRKEFREFQCRKCNHKFKVSHLRLVFTVQFRGKDPAPTGTAAFHVKCPNCGNKSWLVPLE
jgi:hypothetical protein